MKSERRAVAILAVIAGPATMPASADTLFDNGSPNGVNGYSNATAGVFGARRTMLDDFVVPAGGWTIQDFHWHHVWDTLPAGSGTGVELTIWSDAGGQPGAPLKSLVITSYSEAGTGNTFFSRPGAESWVTFDDVNLGAGTHWIEWTIVGPEDNLALTADRNNDPTCTHECWVNYDDQGGLTSGSKQFGVEADLAWSLTGVDSAHRPGGSACPEDLDESGAADFGDILAILAWWGESLRPEDLDGNCTVDFGDILLVLKAWGPCGSGACCFDDGLCHGDTSQGECQDSGGYYQGHRTSCAGLVEQVRAASPTTASPR